MLLKKSENIYAVNRSELQSALIEYIEGRLDAAQTESIEEVLRSSNSLREEYELLKTAFQTLQIEEQKIVPSGYFSTILPRVHNRIGDNQSRQPWIIPSWIEKLLQPAAAISVVSVLAILFTLFQPNLNISGSAGADYEHTQELITIIDPPSTLNPVSVDDPEPAIPLLRSFHEKLFIASHELENSETDFADNTLQRLVDVSSEQELQSLVNNIPLPQ
jgi:hypothetical protein